MTRNRLFWLVAVLAFGDYLVMILWSVPKLSRDAGGLAIFDMRPGGYSFEEAQSILQALSPTGLHFYETVQHRLDTAYPLLLAVTIGWAIFRLAPAPWGVLRYALAATALPGMVFDYLENADVSALLAAGPDGITPALVETASFHSQAKAISTSVAMLILLLLLADWSFRRLRGRAGH